MNKHIGIYSNKFTTLVDNPCGGCKWFQKYGEPYGFGEIIHIGWCARYEPDPDAGYVALHRNPPCLLWGYEAQEVKGKAQSG